MNDITNPEVPADSSLTVDPRDQTIIDLQAEIERLKIELAAMKPEDTVELPFSKTVILVDLRYAEAQYNRHIFETRGVDYYKSRNVFPVFHHFGLINAIRQLTDIGLDDFNEVHFFWAFHNTFAQNISDANRTKGRSDADTTTWLRTNPGRFKVGQVEKIWKNYVHTGSMRTEKIPFKIPEDALPDWIRNPDPELSARLRRDIEEVRNSLLSMEFSVPRQYEKGVDELIGLFMTIAAQQKNVDNIIILTGDGDFRCNIEYALGEYAYDRPRDRVWSGFPLQFGKKKVTIVTNPGNPTFDGIVKSTENASIRYLSPKMMDLAVLEETPEIRAARQARRRARTG